MLVCASEYFTTLSCFAMIIFLYQWTTTMQSRLAMIIFL